jgi:hypothetical protein
VSVYISNKTDFQDSLNMGEKWNDGINNYEIKIMVEFSSGLSNYLGG